MDSPVVQPSTAPFAAFLGSVPPESPLRAAITAHYRAPEPGCCGRADSRRPAAGAMAERAGRPTARHLVALRAKGTKGAVQGLVREYDLSSQEGVALMCLAEALLRIPDRNARCADPGQDRRWGLARPCRP